MEDETYVTEQQPTEAYALPELSPVQVAELEALTAGQVATVRDERSTLIANLGMDQLPHFLVTREDGEFCGGCGDPWPCVPWTDEVQPAAEAASADVEPTPTYSAAEVAMAEELGITAAEVRERMRAR